MNFAGVTIDFYDDKGATIRAKFPDHNQLPDFIKQANVQPREDLPNEAFALVAIDNGQVIRKFACYDPGTTAMSVMYLMEHGDKLPEEAIKMAAANLVEACEQFGVAPPVAIMKAAGLQRVKRIAESGLKKLRQTGTMPKGLADAGRTGGEKLRRRVSRYPGGSNEYLPRVGLSPDRPPEGARSFAEMVLHAKPAGPVKTSSVVDTTGKTASAKIKVARPMKNEDYCVVAPDGRKFYPIDTIDRVKTAEVYWLENQQLMEPAVRRQYATKLAAKADTLDVSINSKIKEAGAPTYAKSADIKVALEMRKMAAPDKENCKFLDELFEKRASIHPEVYAKTLQRFDVESGLDRLWDRHIPDPWSSTFGINKTADVVVWEDGADRVTEGELKNLAQNRLHTVEKVFTLHFANDFREDPVGIFESMPLTQKRMLARMATNMSADGSSEFDSEAPAPGEYKAQ